MRDKDKTKEQLINELVGMHQRIAELETSEAEHKRAEEALQESGAKYSVLVEKARDGIIILQDEVVKYCNNAVTEMIGYTQEELIGRHFLDTIPPDSTDIVAQRYQARLAGKEVPDIYETKTMCNDGTTKDVEASGVVILYEGKPADMVIIRDISERKRAEEALRESEEKLRRMFESATDGVTVIDLNGVFIEANQRIADILGFGSRQEVLGKSAFDFTAPGDRKRAMMNMQKTLKEGSVEGVEYTLLKADGSGFPAELSASVFRDASGSPAGFITITRDITERKKMEEALRESEAKYSALVEQARDAVYIIQDGVTKFCNKAAEELTGYKREELLGMPFLDLMAPESRDIVEQRYQSRMAAKKPPSVYEIELQCKDGTSKYVETSAMFIQYQGRPAGMGVVRNITERRQWEQRITRAAEEWRATFDSITDLVSIHGEDFKITRVNMAFADVFGMHPKEIIGKICYELVHGTKEPCLNCPLKQTFETKKPCTVEFFEPNLGIHLEVAASPIFDEQGEVVGVVRVARDITERKRMEEQLIITDRLASIGQLASGVAHELNNPLTGVIGFSQLLLERDVPEDIREDIDIVYREAQRAGAVVKNLLTFSRKHAPAKQSININSIIEKVLELRDYEQKASNIQGNTQFASDLPEIIADYFQLQQVFLNIIINAEQSMIEAHNGGILKITTEKDGDVIKASFADDGLGIDEGDLGHVFDPFFTTKEVGKGTGLGLSVCHGIISEHSGKIYAESELGQGATFIVELPINSTPDERRATE
jgi:PAS domain S-box-containing protein